MKYLYWFIQLTWGIITTTLGFLVTFILRCFGRPSYKNGYGMITTVGGNWGGLSLGPFAFCGTYNEKDSKAYYPYWYEHTRRHEFGHSFQVLIFGPLWLFVVALPSAIRYWYQRLTPKKKHKEYDDIWFEYTASKWGYAWISKIENSDMKYTYTRKK